MRPVANFTLHAILAACLAALAASSAAAGKPLNDNEGHAFLTFELMGSGTKGNKGEKLEVQSFQWGPRQTTSADGSIQKAGKESDASAGKGASNEMRMEDSAGGSQAGGANAGRVTGIASNPSEPAAARQQVRPVMSSGYAHVVPPRGPGSLRIKVKFPWVSCQEGRTYPSLELSNGARRYVLKDVVVSSCGGTSAGPEEHITFVYGKIGV